MAGEILELTRDQLAKFLGNDRNAILVFEALLARGATVADVTSGGTGNSSFPTGGVLLGNGILPLLTFLSTSNESLWGAGSSGIDDDAGFTRTGGGGRYLFGATDDGVGKVQINGDLRIIDTLYNAGSSIALEAAGLTLVASTNIGSGGAVSLTAGGGTNAGDISLNGVNGSISGSTVLIVTGNGPTNGTLIVTDVAGTGTMTYAPVGDTLSVGNLNLGTPLPLSEGGTASALADPGADRIMFWDDSAGVVDWLTVGTGLSISGTTLSSGGSPTYTNLTLTGLLDISAAGAGQIKFPATPNLSSDPNVLDDYEEGTFTPGISFGGGATGVTYSSQPGVYVKIGSFVNVTGSVILSNKGSSSGAASLTGLPFTSQNTTNIYPTGASQFTLAGAFSGSPYLIVNQNTTIASINYFNEGSGSGASMSDANFSNTSQIFGFSISYFT